MFGFRVIQGCPVFGDIGPYIAIILDDAHATVNSIYRGTDAEAILNRHGHSSQRQLYELFLEGRGNPANPPGRSTHELRSDGVAYRGYAPGRALPWWCQGFDVNDSEVMRVEEAAARYGWHLFRPYPSGREYHHLNFRSRPHPTPRTVSRIWRLRVTLPRR